MKLILLTFLLVMDCGGVGGCSASATGAGPGGARQGFARWAGEETAGAHSERVCEPPRLYRPWTACTGFRPPLIRAAEIGHVRMEAKEEVQRRGGHSTGWCVRRRTVTRELALTVGGCPAAAAQDLWSPCDVQVQVSALQRSASVWVIQLRRSSVRECQQDERGGASVSILCWLNHLQQW